MQCKEVRDQFTDYVIGHIDASARQRIDQHLMDCESCRTEAQDVKSLWADLGSLPSQEPSPELRSRFQIMLQAYEHGLDNAYQRRSWWTSLNAWLAGLWPKQPAVQMTCALALLIIGVVGGVVVGQQFHLPSVVNPTPANSEVVQLRDELSQMRQMVALSLMQQQSASERLKGVNWSYQLKQPDGKVLSALLDTLMHDSSVNVRLATVDALRQFGDQLVVRHGVVQAIAREGSPMVQVALIDLAVDLHEKESIENLRQLLQDQTLNPAVRDRAEKGLAELE
jgi:anti-sigma-K factor RskA